MATIPHGLRLRQRLPVSARSRPPELPPNLQKYVDTFYYRLHSPVILIEFDHQRGIVFDNDGPSRHHIHTIVRTPNGNDYGRDLLRQHHARFDHTRPDHRH